MMILSAIPTAPCAARQFVVALALVAVGCGGSDSPSTPTAPSPPATPAPTSVTLAGVVRSSVGNAGIAGATVVITDGANAGRSVTTNSSGNYTFSGLTPANANVFARADGWDENGGGLFIDGRTNLNFTLRLVPYSRAGAGNAVFDVPVRETRIQVFARWSGSGTSNFIMRHVGGFGIVNEILRERNPYTGTHVTDGGRLEIISSGNIVEWRITEQP